MIYGVEFTAKKGRKDVTLLIEMDKKEGTYVMFQLTGKKRKKLFEGSLDFFREVVKRVSQEVELK